MKKCVLLPIMLGCVLLSLCGRSQAAIIFSDDFMNAASLAWGNEVGDWYINSEGGYDTHFPYNDPPTYSSVTTLPNLTDFEVEFDVNHIGECGVFLRSSDNLHGIMLASRRQILSNANGILYWHIIDGYTHSLVPYNGIGVDFNSTVDRIRVRVTGNLYEAYLNNSILPVTTFETDYYASGKVALYDNQCFYNDMQSFGNFSISANEEPFPVSAVPEPATAMLFVPALLGLVAFRRLH